MTDHQIVAVRKPDRNSPVEHITHVQYDGVIKTREYVISLIENKTDRFYTNVAGTGAWIEVVSPGNGRSKYIRSVPDGTKKDNLLSLPPC
jgi:hypothetical protein